MRGKVVDGHGHPGDPDLVLHFAICRALGFTVFAHVPHRLVMARLADELTWAVEHAPPAYAVLNAGPGATPSTGRWSPRSRAAAGPGIGSMTPS